jgi:two-component system, chemotaxis family, sensor kinase CheA
MDDIIQEFVAETMEQLEQLDTDIVALEQNPHDTALITSIFRVLHTIKGTSGFLGLERLGRVAHKGEDVLGLLRDGVREVTPDAITLILEALDCLKGIMVVLAATGAEPDGDDSALIARLEAAYAGQGEGHPPLTSPLQGGEMDAVPPLQGGEVKAVPSLQEGEVEAPPPPKPEAHSLRVSMGVLENLMTMVSELVLTRNQLSQIARQQGEGTPFAAPLQTLNHIVSELQEGVMKTRMQPIGNAWGKLPRIVRDVSADLGKHIDLTMSGQDTELDRQVLEMIKDPLTHMVRNSCDHGIERPEARAAAGKPEGGTIALRAFHQGGHIIVEIADDGAGLPMAKIRNKVAAAGLATAEQLAAMPDHQVQRFIFHPGLSTAEQVTAVSGRGVGMDVVRANIEKIGGSIDLRSAQGQGTTFTIKIPLTLAIVSALIVRAGGQRFALPQLAVSELVLVGADTRTLIEEVNGAHVMRLRDRLLPLISLAGLLGLPEAQDAGECYVVVTRAGPTEFGLIVDEVYDLEEIVIKPLARALGGLGVFSGNTILGDGRAIMILDPAGLLKAVDTGAVPEGEDETREGARAAQAAEETLLLLFHAGGGVRKAAPVDAVVRLEDIKTEHIVQTGGRAVIPYRGCLLPVEDWSTGQDGVASRPMILLRAAGGRVAGLIADQILDVVPHAGALAGGAQSLLLNGVPTEVIDAAAMAAHGVHLDDAHAGEGQTHAHA